MTLRSYADWLHAQPPEVQDRILGKRQAAAFRAGTLAVDKYSDPPGRMTLDDLAASTPWEPRRAEVISDDEKE